MSGALSPCQAVLTPMAEIFRPRQSVQHPFCRVSQCSFRSAGSFRSGPPLQQALQGRQHATGMSTRASSSSERSSGAPSAPRAHTASPEQPISFAQRIRAAAAASAMAAALAISPLAVSSAIAADPVQVGTCLLESCQGQLASCLVNGDCLKNLVCLNKCNGLEDESDCQIKCGDLYENETVQAFNECAVSLKKCVPQRVDEDLFRVPAAESLVEKFDLKKFTGRWYITAGLNPLFDQFPCQEHFFGNPEPGVLFGKINWRVPKGEKGEFLQRGVTQTFRQTENPAVLLNHNNAYLHYEDDWYILASKPNEYVVVYYIGNNDAWKGYGGATVYTREKSLPKKYIPEIKEALEKANLNYTWDDFVVTDNSCPPKPMAKSLFAEAEKDVEQLFTSFGKGFTILESQFETTLQDDEKEIEREMKYATEYLRGVEKEYEMTLFDLPPFKWFVGKKAPPAAVITPLTGSPLKAGDGVAPCETQP